MFFLAWGTSALCAPVAVAREPDTACAKATLATAGPQPSAQYSEYRARLHSFATGAGVKVAVIDTGVAAHPQLRVTPGADFVTPEEPDPLRDCDLHGTVVAGVIAGKDLGVAPDAEIYSIRQTSSHYRTPAPENEAAEGVGSGTLASLAAAIEDAVNAGAQVINVSVVSCVPPRPPRGSIDPPWTRRCSARKGLGRWLWRHRETRRPAAVKRMTWSFPQKPTPSSRLALWPRLTTSRNTPSPHPSARRKRPPCP